MSKIDTLETLEALYGDPAEAALVKVTDWITPEYRALIAASPFAALASAGPEGLDCTPRGDGAGFVRVHDDETLMMPDRRGNNRIDTLRNILADPRVALLFLIPGSGTTLRVNGRAHISADSELLESFRAQGKAPRSVVVIAVEAVYFQCARAILRADLWNPDKHLDPKTLPSPGQILAARTQDRVGGADYDKAWQGRAKKTLW